MNSNLTLLTAITLTAAATAGGTYYLTTQTQPDNAEVNAPSAAIEAQPTATIPVQVAANQDPNQPITIIVKTELTEHKQPTRDHVGHIRDLKQPHYGVTQAPTIPLNH
ncbi:hypothetical protein JWZ98_23020 (plasmid) [Methylomonas sp. EFPC1]|uniref:Uncharacterized protein n=1 Tax=Methylomonas rosea TaxID=2952227 RepID=A0ABT1TVS1_9GAMM|nr:MULTISPECIES: hypothetical protein [unclassified Methylomonas]MCQ8118486.1 hypothetical protein [Methylomonas sp. WSC-7]PPD24648.1 MAG: hypothetical protein CTY24_00235 [Methylobacter sp.]QSB03784.1 hypothetical protein JWZ98_23020 [Methylomonas sp. EFPC1]